MRRSLTSFVGRLCQWRLYDCRCSLVVTMSSSTVRPITVSSYTTTSTGRPTGDATSQQLDLSGIFPPIATPFDNDENIDYDKLEFNLRRWNDIPFKGNWRWFRACFFATPCVFKTVRSSCLYVFYQ